MTADRDALVEKMARAMIANDSGPEGSALFNIHNKEFGYAYRESAAIALDIAMEEAARVADAAEQRDRQAAKEPCDDEELAAFRRGAFMSRNIAAAIRAYISKP